MDSYFSYFKALSQEMHARQIVDLEAVSVSINRIT